MFPRHRLRHARGALGALLGIVLLATLPAIAQDLRHPVAARAEARPAGAAPGDTVTVALTVTIDPGYHIYGLPPVPELTYATRVELLGPEGFEAAGEATGPEAVPHENELLGTVEPWFTGTVLLELPVRVPADAEPGPVTLTLGLSHMACTEEICLDPVTLEATATLTVTAGAAPPPPDDPSDSSSGPPAPGGAGAFLWIAFVGGLGSILFPCIYPLIPLTVAFFTKHEGSRGSAVFRAALFCVGIVVTFTLLGVVLGPALQLFATHPLLNLFLFLLMVVLALSLFGMFDIRLPSALTDRLQALGHGASLFAPVFMGLAFSLASFTCVVGVIGPLLAGAAAHPGSSAAGMLAYSLGFAVPFFLLALFPMVVSSLPRGGSWMNTIKVLLGFFEVCFAGYYLWRLDLALGWGVGTYPVVLSLWVVTTVLAGLYLLGLFRLPHDPPLEGLPVPRLLLAIVFLVFGLFLMDGLLGDRNLPSWIQGLLPPRAASAAARAGASGALPAAGPGAEAGAGDPEFHPGYGGVAWTTDYEHGLAVGRREGRRILLNFTGIYCVNCREMETGLLPDPEVRAELEKLVCVELWTDLPSDEAGRLYRTHTTKAMSDRYRKLRTAQPPAGYGTAANPYYAVLAPDGTFLAGMGYTRDAQAFAGFLRTGAGIGK